VLAAQADARWNAKPRYLDMPGREIGRPVPALKLKDPGGYSQDTRPDGRAEDGERGGEGLLGSNVKDLQPEGPASGMQTPDGKRHPFTRAERVPPTTNETKEDPWKKARGGPSEDWQPQAWDPNALAARR